VDAEPVKLAETASAVEASFAGREYRGRPALCAGVQGRQRTAGVKGETPCPGRVDACVNSYWVIT